MHTKISKQEEGKRSLQLKIYSQEESLNVIFEQARTKAEEEVRTQIKMRDDEIRSYIDQQLVKFTTETTEEAKLLELGRELYTTEHPDYPFFPATFGTHFLQQAVIVTFIFYDVATQVQHRYI